ncbi:MAG TPA: NAD-dependent epimerase/dehydratase family protein, partial [Calditrichia bacterium]|nr:NAD-dependent epimerase/dehydratase family protein [Calditrichia bacterium]
MTKILVLGGAGFIGLNLCRELLKKDNCRITIGDNFFRGKMDQALLEIAKDPRVKIVEGDFTHPAAFEDLNERFDQVYMLASVVGVKYTEEIPNELIRINGSLILNTLEWLKRVGCGKVLFTSTSECYAGAIEAFDYLVPTPEEVPLCIEDIGHPRFTYAVTKMLGESGFLNYARVFGFECSIVRYHNVYGPRMGFKHVIPQVVQRFLQKENPFRIYSYNHTRAFNYIDDAVRGTILAMDSPRANGQIYHIGDMNAEISIEQLVRLIGEIMGYNGEFHQVEAISGSVSRRCPDTRKAERELGYLPAVSWQRESN